MGKSRGLIRVILMIGLFLMAFQEKGYGAPIYDVRTEGNGIINKDTGQQNVNGALIFNGQEWIVNNTWAHQFFVYPVDHPNAGQRVKNYDNPQTVTGASPTGVILNYGDYQITRSIYSYSKPARNGTGTYVYLVVEYVTHNTVTGKNIILRSRGTGNGTSSAYFDVYIDDDTTSGIPDQATAFRGDPVWFTYPGTAADAVSQTSPTLNRTGDLPSVTLPPSPPQHSNGYYLDINNGADMGGKSFQLITQFLNDQTTNLNSSHIVQFNLKWMNAQGNLDMISFFPSIVSETFQASSAAVPTQSEWGMLLLMILTGVSAVCFLKKIKARERLGRS